MSSPTRSKLAEYIKDLKTVSFTNKHGEKFYIHSNGITVFMSGDEVNMMVDPKKTIDGYLPLFSSSFGIWSADELYKLGDALKKLHKEMK